MHVSIGHIRHSAELICEERHSCHYQYNIEFLFNNAQTVLCPQLRHGSISVGYIKLRHKTVKMVCNKDSLFWKRDTYQHVEYIIRCRWMGCVKAITLKTLLLTKLHISELKKIPRLIHGIRVASFSVVASTACACYP